LGRALAACRATTVIVILDCCFSGRADLDPTGVPPSVFRLPPIHGVYQLGSAEQLALADPTQRYTAFSGELIRLLDQGDPRGGAELTLDDAYDPCSRHWPRNGRPPSCGGSRDASGGYAWHPTPPARRRPLTTAPSSGPRGPARTSAWSRTASAT